MSFEALAGTAGRGANVAACEALDPPDGERREQAERLTREVERLPHPLREVLMLYYYQDAGCTYAELAELLGVSAATINARLTRARQMLRARMMAECEPGADRDGETV